MSSPAHPPSPVSPEFAAIFRRHAGVGSVIRFDKFVDLALYDPEVGYYRSARKRVGRAAGTDFHTATSLGPVFGQLVVAAGISLLGSLNPRSTTFVEIGAEPGACVLDDIAHPFGVVRTLRLGSPLSVEGQCIVFSNELFDAQPFRRFRRRRNAWVEIGVKLADAGLFEVELDECSERWLPETAEEGYCFDAPRAATELAHEIARQEWTGLFLAFDYGKSFEDLAHDTPQGTARAYFAHRQSNDLLRAAGKQDLTCHICWDWLANAIEDHAFARVQVQSQESFFVHHAGNTLSRMIDPESTLGRTERHALMQLLHPLNMGQKFQVLHGLRS